jgi:hypothetical protein
MPGPARQGRQDGTLKTHLIPVPVVDLPLGATEDRVVGALDLERALSQGVKAFEPGLLARAHRGFLYIDEVNLLEDHLVDLLIDVASSGENVVERDGLSVRHPARFVLVGSGNPEEGELRPQLLDRFGLSVEVKTPDELAARVEVVRRREAFENDPPGFTAQWKKEDERTRKRIVAGREHLQSVDVPQAARERAAALCMALGTDGLRGDLTLIRAARALAALQGDSAVATPTCGRSRPRRCATACVAIHWTTRAPPCVWTARSRSCSAHESAGPVRHGRGPVRGGPGGPGRRGAARARRRPARHLAATAAQPVAARAALSPDPAACRRQPAARRAGPGRHAAPGPARGADRPAGAVPRRHRGAGQRRAGAAPAPPPGWRRCSTAARR